MDKNKMAIWGRNFAAELFPVWRKWRMWLAYFGPFALAFAWPQIVEPNLLNFALVVSFILLLGRPASRYLIRAQCRFDARLQIRLFDQAQTEIKELLDFVPTEDRRQFAELADDLARRSAVLKKILMELEK